MAQKPGVDQEFPELEMATDEPATSTTKTKVLSPEEIEALNAGIEKMKSYGVSEKFSKVLELVPEWHDKEGNKVVKDAVIGEFGGSEEFKNYIDDEFQTELLGFSGMQKVVSTLNNIKSFYARRESTRKPKTLQVSIDGVTYNVNAEFFATLEGVSREDRITAILEHPDTKQNVAIEVL